MMRHRAATYVFLLCVGASASVRSDSSTGTELTLSGVRKLQPMWELLDVAIGNYNRGDEQAFRALFAQKAVPMLTERVYSSVYLGYYREVFGKIEGDAFLNAETVPDSERGVLVLEAKSEKVPKVKVSCNFLLEGGVMRIAQLRFEKL